MVQIGEVLWQPAHKDIGNAPITRFARKASKLANKDLSDYRDLHQWSIKAFPQFWDLLWDFAGVIGQKGKRATDGGSAMPGTKFFPDARINYAENLLKKGGSTPAIIFRGEDKVKQQLSFDQLRQKVARAQAVFAAAGIKPGDRIAAMIPNMPEAIIAMLAASSLGAVWSSCSPDFGVGGVLDRFGQIEPLILIACDGYWYNGKEITIGDKLSEIVQNLSSLKKVLVVDYLGKANELVKTAADDRYSVFDEALNQAKTDAKALSFARLGFDHPLYILFSSGTTGKPKCIVHGQGGMLLQHLKEHHLHLGLGEGDRAFYFTTCGWMMWNWLVSALALGTTVMLYDGSPFYPGPEALFDYAQEEKFTLFGTSAKFIDAVRNSGLRPIQTHDLASVKVMTSTGSPLAPENFRFVYEAIKADIHLASVSGGTDIAACFVGGIPTYPVRMGEIQGAVLGMASDVRDGDGRPVTEQKGELVCTRPFPSMPIGFWNDEDGKKYHKAYFDRFDGIWCHGDFAEWTKNGGMIIHGRSDATLNPGGVRIGTAEIYNQVEQIEEVFEALCVGQNWQGDTRIVLFVRLNEGAQLDEALQKRIKQKIRTGASPRHVPAKIIKIADIPRTKSGKITELAVRDIIHGQEPGNIEALANPEALDHFRDLEALKS